MRSMRSVLLGLACIAALGSTAGADDTWQNVTLDDGITMDIPAVVGSDYKPDAKDLKKGDLMFFDVTGEEDGDLTCLLQRQFYAATFSHANALAGLATRHRDVLCTAGDGQTNTKVLESESLSVSGYPAGLCAASYTAAGDKQPGQVDSELAVVTPKAFFLLTCTLSMDEQDEAEIYWASDWGDTVDHIQQSLHLPPSGR